VLAIKYPKPDVAAREREKKEHQGQSGEFLVFGVVHNLSTFGAKVFIFKGFFSHFFIWTSY
jgi:hypothetical protein